MIYYLNHKSGEYNASGEMILNNNFKVFKGSTIRQDYSRSEKYTIGVNKTRANMIDVKIRLINDKLTLIEDCIFSSPSLAAAIVKGRDCNGWLEWKTTEGLDLDSTLRSQ